MIPSPIQSVRSGSSSSRDSTLLVICVGYAIYSAVRRTLSVSLPLLIADLSLSKSEVGIIASNFSLAYGFIFTALFCVAFTLGTSVQYLSMIWFLNGCVQGVGWPALASIIFENFESSMRGAAWSAATSSGNLGYILGPFFFNYLLSIGWKGPFYGAGFFGILAAPLCYFIIREKRKVTSAESSSNSSLSAPPQKESSGYQWLLSFPIWSLLLSSGLTYFILKGVADWIGLYAVEYCHWTQTSSTMMMFWSEVGGMVGSLSSGFASDYLFSQRRDVTSLIFSLLVPPAFIGIPFLLAEEQSSDELSWRHVAMCFCLFLVGMGVNGPKTLIGVSLRESVPSDAIGLAGGLLGIIGQVGGAAAGVVIGYALQTYSWSIFIPMLLISGVSTSVLILIYILSNPTLTLPNSSRHSGVEVDKEKDK